MCHETISLEGFVDGFLEVFNEDLKLICMLFDSRPDIRQLAVARIREARDNQTGVVRMFVPPKINFDAQEYTDMVDWLTTPVTPPPLLADITIQELETIADTGTSDRREFKLPSHTQAVERVVKEVTRAARNVFGQSERDGFIKASMLDRELCPAFSTKQDFQQEGPSSQK